MGEVDLRPGNGITRREEEFEFMAGREGLVFGERIWHHQSGSACALLITAPNHPIETILFFFRHPNEPIDLRAREHCVVASVGEYSPSIQRLELWANADS